MSFSAEANNSSKRSSCKNSDELVEFQATVNMTTEENHKAENDKNIMIMDDDVVLGEPDN